MSVRVPFLGYVAIDSLRVLFIFCCREKERILGYVGKIEFII